eukprot:363009-Chlamydomonas_euryale.AAC.2
MGRGGKVGAWATPRGCPCGRADAISERGKRVACRERGPQPRAARPHAARRAASKRRRGSGRGTASTREETGRQGKEGLG